MIPSEKVARRIEEVTKDFDIKKLLQAFRSCGVKGLKSDISIEDRRRLEQIHDRLTSLEYPVTVEDTIWLWQRLNKSFQEQERLQAKIIEVTGLYVKSTLGALRLA